MKTTTQLIRDLLITANNFQAQFGSKPIVHNVYMTVDMYERLQAETDEPDFGSIHGYLIFLVNDDRHPDYVVCVR